MESVTDDNLEQPPKATKFEKVLLWLSLYVVVELYVSSVTEYTQLADDITYYVDFGICMIFLYDFFNGLWKAENKWKFVANNWVDFVASIPTVGFLRAARIFKIFKLLRVLRSAKYVFQFFNRKTSFSTFRNVVVLNVVVVLLFTISFYHAERDSNPHISTFTDSLWWTTITTMTVGFLQDIPPVTPEGKVLSVVLIFAGMIIGATMIATITDYFIEDEDIQVNVNRVHDKLIQVEKKLDALAEKLEELSKSQRNGN
jgi:voltage-gated potassium channel